MKRLLYVPLVSALLAWSVPSATAQALDDRLVNRCQALGLSSQQAQLCQDAVATVQLLQPELGLGVAAGNPVLGTASPIGTRFRFIPRVQLGGRITFIWAGVPDVIRYPEDVDGSVGTRSFSVPVPQFDVSVGVFDGLKLGSTLSGFASVELLGSLSTVILPSDAGFRNDVGGVGLGARVGVLRESFTAPGISLSGMYKWAGRIEYGRLNAGDDAALGMDLSLFSFRLSASKSFVAIGLAATIGWDHYSSDVDLQLAGSAGAPLTVIPVSAPEGLGSGRWSAVLDVSYIVLFLNFVAEAGWQEKENYSTSTGLEVESGKFFGTIGVRLTL
jgi:hypothetical protein